MVRRLQLACLLFGGLLLGCQSTPVTAPQTTAVSSKPTVSTRASHLRGEVLLQALGLVGTPYRYGGNTPGGGFDCSGLIGYVFRQAVGISLPRTTGGLMSMSVPRVKRSALEVGDLVFFATNGGKKVSHAGIYSGDGRFVHAPSSGGTVRMDYLSDRYWSKRYLGANRVLP
ncbi:hydrolase Nlp/P60 [Ventosimonas gracilis]|uniref:Hydrolase Nlp/P60 n=1 Tax=Ventosimonas gracilis TaxID=1680762 RepID=A0A139SJ99_9GAMM|nr:hydrolase Nlp/P60 [Ventosimonas gracilis]